MKRLNHKFKKGLALLLILAMAAGLVPAMPDGAHEVQAATTSSTGGTPSVSAYATKEQMMDGTFATNTEGIADNYGKILFGKAELFNNTSDTHPIEWLILGKDEGVAGDNTIILATRMINFVQYNTTQNNTTQNMYINIADDITENDDGAVALTIEKS